MKIIVALAAFSTSLVSAKSILRTPADTEPHRYLQNITDALCAGCQLCSDLGDLCAINDVADLACANCASFNVDGLCESCDLCDSAGAEVCNPEAIKDLGCGLCDIEEPDDSWFPFTCFSEVATVQALGPDNTPTTKSMKDLNIGDHVLTEDGTFSQVYGFGHHHPNKQAQFFQIHSKNADKPLEVTADHLVFKFVQNTANPVPAQTIQVGDVLLGANGVESPVTKIGTVNREGIYAPLTMDGTLLVDGVAASSYIAMKGNDQQISDHEFIHLGLSPLRVLCNGVSPAFCDTRFHHENGMPLYAYFGLELVQWLLQANVLLKTIGMSTIYFLTGTSQVLENTFGASLAPLAVFIAAAVYANRNHGKKETKAKVV